MMYSSIIPLLLLILGIAVGSFVKLQLISITISLLLYSLILLIGITLGRRKIVLRVKDLEAPVLTLVGTLIPGAIVAPIIGIPVNVSVAISAGFGWYSLAGPLITKICGAKAGTIAFLSNLFREAISLALARTISEKIGCGALVASIGAGSMDTALPFVAQVCDYNWVVRSFISGLVLTLLAPLLIPLLLGL
jgi:uncharacterized membrane protein YbjE (DUF340 family)